eukprot:gene6288-11707_t
MLIANILSKWVIISAVNLVTVSLRENHNCGDYKFRSISTTIDDRILDSIEAAASTISRNANNCEELYMTAYEAVEIIFFELSGNDSGNVEDESNTKGGSNYTMYTDFFNSLKILIARAIELRKQMCASSRGTFNEKTAVCSIKNEKQTSPNHLNNSNGILFYLQVVGNSLSIISLTCLLFMLLCFKELQSVPGRYIKHLATVLAIGHALLLMKYYAAKNTRFCAVVGIWIHWVYLTAFCTMAMIALSTTRTFCQPLMTSQCEKVRRYRLAIKTAYGFPLVIITPCTIIHFVSPEKMSYGVNGECFISNVWASIATFLIPIGCVLLFNCICLVAAVSKIHRMNKENSKILRKGSRSSVLRTQSTVMVLKLGTFTGIGWIFGFISGLAGVEAFDWLFKILCSFQGFGIFAAFAFTTRIYNLLMKKIKKKAPRNKLSLEKNPRETRLTQT